ncbi:transposase family protein [Streptomyces sioyaensis]|uniref:transposase family protein n=1 Tax=Streptomyces sioyaensis TaxID=67364 RepID=UPI0037CF682D
MDVNYLVETVFSGLAVLVVEDVVDGGDVVVVTARTRDVAVPCPACRTPTAKVHGYHRRTVTDVPVDGRPVVVHLRVRRLVCPALGCRDRPSASRLPDCWSAISAVRCGLPGRYPRWRGSYSAGRPHT